MKKPTPAADQELTPPEGMEVVQSVKKKVKQLIPVDDAYVYQSNKVTLSKYRTSLVLERLFTLIQYELQGAVRNSMRGDNNYSQLELFNEESNLLEIKIPLRYLTKANSLDVAIDTCKSLMDLKISFPSYSQNGKVQYLSLRQAVHGVDIPIRSVSDITKGKNAGSKRINRDNVIISMTKDQADRFILVDVDPEHNRPIRYTKFLLQTAINAKSKHSARLYKLVSSWQARKGFTVTVDWLKEYLDIKGIDDKGQPFDLYPYFSDLKKRVLEPARVELHKKTDCWFEYAPGQVQGKKVLTINFVVITPELEKVQGERRDYIRHLLKTHYDFDSIDMKAVKGLFEPDIDPDAVTRKIMAMHEIYIRDRAKIDNKKGWAVRCLKTYLSTGK